MKIYNMKLNVNLMITTVVASLVILFSGTAHVYAYANPATVNLGGAAGFAALSKVSISSVPTSIITGDIGVSPTTGTAITGFTCSGTAITGVTGTAHVASAGGDTLNCQTVDPAYLTPTIGAMQAAYTDALSRARDLTLGGDIGGLTLTPGVYFTASGLGISTDVNLDCSANADGVFIFQIGGNLSLAASTTVQNGSCNPANIFWAVAGTTNIGGGVGTASTFAGTVLGGPGTSEITVITGSTIKGRLLGQKGIALDQNIITVPTATPAPTSGPVWEEQGTPNGVLDSGEYFFQTIQSAIDAGTTVPGDTIFVSAGTAGPYSENVTVDKSLTLQGEGDTTIINGNINATGDNVIIKNLKVTNSDTYGYGVKPTAGKVLTLENVTVDVLYYAVRMTGGSAASGTAITINNSDIKGYSAIYLNGAGATDAVVNVNNTALIGRTSYSGSTDDFAVVSIDNTSGVTINFTGTSSVANEYTNSAQSKERLVTFYSTDNASVTGTPTYTNAANSTVNANAIFASAYGPYTNTVEGQAVARYVSNTAEFELALASASTTPIVVGRYETTYSPPSTPIVTTQATSTVNTGAILIIEDHNIVTITSGTTLVNNGTIVIENDVTFTNNGTILNHGTITGTVINNGTRIDITKPVITLLGVTPNIGLGSTYTELGATAVDSIGNPVAVIISGSVNTAVVGSYTITYTATDTFGNTATATRTVNVVRTNNGEGSGGGGGGGSVGVGVYHPAIPATPAVPGVSPAVPATPAVPANPRAQGQVLGASAFSFNNGLALGSRNDDVIELQNRLTAEGVYFGPITGYFGSLTAQGVKNFQKKYGISQVGSVGPQTRARLNSVTVTGIPGCAIGNKFNTTTGQSCLVQTSSIPGCLAGNNFSITTGQSCFVQTSSIPGCYAGNDHSITTGQACYTH